jgi:signal peptidase I
VRPSPDKKGEAPKPREGHRETVEAIVVAMILALLVRGFEAEAFVIPTGSMATTLMGRHKEITCPQCGHVYTINASEEVEGFVGAEPHSRRVYTGICVNCRFQAGFQGEVEDAPSFKGDRILVMKFPYDFPGLPGSSTPERWDVVVFRYPEEPEVSYIKRLVGLPGEELKVYFGDVYIKPPGGGQYQLARKPLRHLQAMQMMVYDDTHRAELLSKRPEWRRWTASSPATWTEVETGPTPGHFRITPSGGGNPPSDWAELRYRHLVPDPEQWDAIIAGRDLPRKPRSTLITDFYSYNTNLWEELSSGGDLRLMYPVNSVSSIPTVGKHLVIVASVDDVLHFRTFDGDGKIVVDTDEKRLTNRAQEIEALRKQLERSWPPHELSGSEKGLLISAVRRIVGHPLSSLVDFSRGDPESAWLNTWLQPHWVGDLALSARLTVTAPGGAIRFELIEGGIANRCEIDLTSGKATLRHGDQVVGERTCPILGTGTYDVSFANIDDRLTLIVDGQAIFGDGATYATPETHPAPTAADLSPVAIAAKGAAVEVSDLVLKRDIYYTLYPGNPEYTQLWEQRFPRTPVELFDILGDSAQFPALGGLRSQEYAIGPDRFMMLGDNSPRSKDSRGWHTRDRYDPDYPYTGWDTTNRAFWEVPRALLTGKAFFVYWPHGQPFGPDIRLTKDFRVPFRPYFQRMKWIR